MMKTINNKKGFIMKKKLIIWFVIVLIIVGGVICYLKVSKKDQTGNISKVSLDVINSNHSDDSMNEVADLIKTKFAEDYPGCTLTTINYDGSKEEPIENYLNEEYNATESFVITFVFNTGNNPPTGFNANSSYSFLTEYVKTDLDGWQNISWEQILS
ncbi:MAG TPA: hypothetical protein PLB45_01870 [Bacilli bacterium]|nr:hypothetical protein [Bacilli bacterium]HPZ23225.1 hypothetical protein [Bacilli bacterium]HQC83607.1 hypothetical protein [Bacilli bacterium]